MRIANKATKGKGKTWSKHQACTSNPTLKKHRSRVKATSSQVTKDGLSVTSLDNVNHTLTVDSLAAHNALHFQNLSLDEDGKSETQSIKTFASVWSSCTNPNFDKFLESWTAGSEVQREMLAILSSAVETIKAKGGSQGNTEYFAILLTLIETTESEITQTATVELLRILIGHMPKAVLVKCFSDCVPVLTKILIKVKDRSNHTLISGLVSCLKHFLRSVDRSVWNESSNVVYLDCLAVLALSSDQNIRTITRKAVNSIAATNNGSADKFASYCIKKMKDTSVKENMHKIVFLMNLMKGIMLYTSQEQLKKCCEVTLSLLTLNNPIINSFGFNILAVPFSSKSSPITQQLAVQIMNALFEFQPQVGSTDAVVSWLSTIKQGYIALKSLDTFSFKKFAEKVFASHVSFYVSDSFNVHTCISNNLKQLIEICLGEETCFNADEVAKISQVIDLAIEFKYSAAWVSSLSVISHKFQIMANRYPAVSLETVKNLSSLREAHQFTHYFELDQAIAVAVTYLGPEKVVQVVNFSLTEKGLQKAWILPLMKGRIVNASLSYFVSQLWPMSKDAKNYEERFVEKNPEKARIFKIIYCQIWSLLPSFCNKPCDLVNSFGSLAPILGNMLKDDPEVRPCILTALRSLVKQSETNEDEKAAINIYCKNFFSCLLYIYTTELETLKKDARLPVYDTILYFVRIAPIDVVQTLLSKAIDKYNSTDEQKFLEKKLAYLDLIRAFVTQAELGPLNQLFNETVEPLLRHRNGRLQKKGYRILEEMCRSSTDSCVNFITQELHTILSTLVKGAESSALPARSAPLNSLRHLIVRFFTIAPEEIEFVSRKLFPLIFKSLQVRTTRVRVASLELIQTLVRASFMQSNGREVIKSLLVEYLMDKTYTDSVLMCICFVFDLLKSNLAASDLVQLVDMIFVDTKSLPMTRAVLAFVKAMLKHMDKDEFVPYLEKSVTWINRLSVASKSKCRIVIKDILSRLFRRYGNDYLSKAICADLSKVVSNIRKGEKKKTRKSKSSTVDDATSLASSKVSRTTKRTRKTIISEVIHESSEDEESDEEFDPKAKKSTPKISLAEDDEDFDLLDSKKKIVHVKESTDQISESDDEIRVGEDGKLIIPGASGMKRKRGHLSDDEDAEEDERDANDTKSVHSIKSSASKYQPGGRGIHRKIHRKHEHLLESINTGDEFKSKRARGDVKRKDTNTDPYAYFPLIRASLNKRRKVSLKDQYKRVLTKSSK